MSAMMLVSSLNIGAAFASDGRIADKGISDVVAYSTTNLNGFFVNPNGNCNYVDGDHYVMTTNKSVSDSGTSYGGINQSFSNEYEIDNTSDIIGSLSFDLAGDAANHATNMLVIAENGLQGSKQQQQCVGMKADRKIGVDADHQSLWNSSISGASITETTSAYHRIGLAFKQNGYVDVYVDGTYLDYVDGSAKLAEGITRGDKFKFYFTVFDPDYKTVTSDADLSKFYLKNLSWQKGSAGLIAEAGSAYASGGEVTIKFSAPVANQTTDGVKLFESATGAEVADITAKFEDDELKVTLPNGLKAGAEYRVEMPKYKDTIGNTLVNDNVYFNVSGGDSTYEVIDLFETFDSMSSDNYTAPSGWTAMSSGSGRGGWMKKNTDGGTTALSIGHAEASKGKWPMEAMYKGFDEKYTSGVLTVSYDIKPENVTRTARNGVAFDGMGFMFKVFPDDIDRTKSDPEVNQGVNVSGIAGNRLGFANGTGSVPASNLDANGGSSVYWTTCADLTNTANLTWHNMKMVFDFDSKVYSFYFDDEKVFESASLMDTFGLAGGIKGIGLAANSYELNSAQLIDNIKVTHSTEKGLGESVNDFSEDWSAYTNHGYSAEEQWTNQVGRHSVRPAYWGHRSYGWAGAALSEPAKDEDNTYLKMGLCADQEWGAPELYHPLNEKYTSGIVTVDYDVKAERIVADTDEDYTTVAYSDKKLNAFNFTLYSEKYDDTQMGLVEMADSKKYSYPGSDVVNSSYGRRVFSITSGEMLVNSSSGSNSVASKQIAGQTWYSMRHVIDIDNNSIETYVKNGDNYELLGVTQISGFDYTNGEKTYFDHNSIGGIGFSIEEKSYLAETGLDNISVTHTPFKSTKGISAVRYNDRDGVTYGSASETTTLIDTIGISFTDAPDSVSDRNFTLTEKGSPDREVSFSGSYDPEHNVYLMELDEYLTAGKTYELKVENVTFGGEAAEVYTHTITSDADGVFEISPITLKVGDTVVTNGTRSLANGDAVKAVMTVTNTTGKSETCALTMGVYKGNQLHAIDFRDITLDGATATGKYANVECTYTVGTDAGDITQVGAFLWDSMSTMKPLRTRAGLNCTNTAE